jgi:hypothetical protein
MPLFNVDPPASPEEVRAAAFHYVKKVSGFDKPSPANEAAFTRAVDEVAAATEALLAALVTAAPPRKRATELPRFGIEDVASFGSGE